MSDDPRARAQARVGTVLADKWTLERLIGLGGMAAVYAGRHRNGARSAIKVLDPALGRVPEVRERFLREGYAANKVEHPGAVKVLDDDVVREGPDEGLAYLVMELLEGESLEEKIHRRGLPLRVDEVLAIAEGVLDVLVAAHAHGVIHRDLKPENLFLVESASSPFGFERVKVLDFGLARLAHAESVTRAGVAIGTPSYMAPEQAEGRADAIDGRTDLFALGAILFRLLAGRRVHEAGHPIELVTKMAKLPAPALRSVRADVPEPVAAIVDRALRFQRDERYASAAAMRDDVRAAREGRPLEPSEPAAIGCEPTLIAETPVPEAAPAATALGPAHAPELAAAPSPVPAAVPPAAPFSPTPHAATRAPETTRRSAPIFLALAVVAVLVLAAAALTRGRRASSTDAEAAASPASPASPASGEVELESDAEIRAESEPPPAASTSDTDESPPASAVEAAPSASAASSQPVQAIAAKVAPTSTVKPTYAPKPKPKAPKKPSSKKKK